MTTNNRRVLWAASVVIAFALGYLLCRRGGQCPSSSLGDASVAGNSAGSPLGVPSRIRVKGQTEGDVKTGGTGDASRATKSGGGRNDAGVTVTPPAGGPSVLLVTPHSDGRYSTTYGLTHNTGTYAVSAQAGAKTAAAKSSFTVQSYPIDVDEDVADNKELLAQPEKLVSAIRSEIAGVPDSPATTDMEAKLDALEAAVRPLGDQSVHLTQALAPFKKMVAENPHASLVLQPMFDHLAALDAQAKKSEQQINQEVAASQKGSQTCDAIDHATQALKAVPEMKEIAKKPWQFAVAFATSMAKSELPESAGPGARADGRAG
jgi:hypothetical protein